jgi:hypothetical protein
MKVTYKETSNNSLFDILKIGDCFLDLNDNVLIKTDSMMINHNCYNAILLSTGKPWFFSNISIVRLVKAELIVEAL